MTSKALHLRSVYINYMEGRRIAWMIPRFLGYDFFGLYWKSSSGPKIIDRICAKEAEKCRMERMVRFL